MHLYPKLDIRVTCDASDYGIGDIVSHRMREGSEKLVGVENLE